MNSPLSSWVKPPFAPPRTRIGWREEKERERERDRRRDREKKRESERKMERDVTWGRESER